MFFKTHAKKPSRHSCICGKEACHTISTSFRKLDDRRGGYFKVRKPPKGVSLTFRRKAISKWIDRLCIHFNLSPTEFGKETCFKLKKPDKVLRSNAQTQHQKDAYVANWHIPPKIWKKYVKEKHVPKYIPLETMKELNLYSKTGGSLYSFADVITDDKGNEEVLVVPTYVDVEMANVDIKDASRSKEALCIFGQAETTKISPSKRGRADETLTCDRRKTRFRKNPENMSNEELLNLLKAKDEQLKAKDDHINDLAKEVDLWREIQSKSQNDVQKHESEEKSNENELDENKVSKAGLTRLSMSNPDFFNEYAWACKEFYGFPDFSYLTLFITKMFEVEYIPPKQYCTRKKLSTDKIGLSKFEQILLTLFFTNTTYSMKAVGIVFGLKSRTLVGSYINKWLPLLGEVGDMLSNFNDLLDSQALDDLEPEWYIKLGLRKVAAVVDGKDFLCETVRTDRTLNCAQSSNKVNHSALRVLTWSLPCGAVIARTPACFGRASEKAILRRWGNLGRLAFAKGCCIFGDKGFDNTAGSYSNFNTTVHPSFLTSPQFSLDEVNHNMLICQKRYTCETVYN